MSHQEPRDGRYFSRNNLRTTGTREVAELGRRQAVAELGDSQEDTLLRGVETSGDSQPRKQKTLRFKEVYQPAQPAPHLSHLPPSQHTLSGWR
ncbi:hypothetical protein CapIbe_016836 [Capra ibex]